MSPHTIYSSRYARCCASRCTSDQEPTQVLRRPRRDAFMPRGELTGIGHETVYAPIPRRAWARAMLVRFMREPEVLRLVGVSDETLRRWEREGSFPRRVKLNPKQTHFRAAMGWRESDIAEWLDRCRCEAS